jgi:hypothetical protein
VEGFTDDATASPEAILSNSDLSEIVGLCSGRLVCGKQPGKFSVDVYLPAVVAK